MIKFPLGLSLLILSIIIGSFQFFEDKDALYKSQQMFKHMQSQIDEMKHLEKRKAKIDNLVMRTGDDQKANIERTLELGGTSLSFRFSSNIKPDAPANRFFYIHEFNIRGNASYFETIKLMQKMENTPGFIITHICFKCGLSGVAKEEGKYPILIRGLIYVSNPDKA